MSATQSPARFEIERPGGTLVVHQLAAGSGDPVVVLLHGITANAYSWPAAANRVAAAHPDATIAWHPTCAAGRIVAGLPARGGWRRRRTMSPRSCSAAAAPAT